MLISTFFIIQCAICCSYCLSPVLKFYAVQQISVQFIFRSIIRIEFYVANFSRVVPGTPKVTTSLELKVYFFPEF